MCHVCFCEGCKFTARCYAFPAARLPPTLTELSLNFCRGEIGDASRIHIFLVHSTALKLGTEAAASYGL